ncbi:hypothetical protein HAX54_039444 [Datura stramonium]|uniref:Uncharacterized protein n=1 Tax=Datura stramonium TaxID=4076 RepID=A0ABS8VLC7_DATST|nr:hypothetical protein [Datura stramonium]
MNRDCSRRDDSDEFIPRKSDKYHKPEAYVPPKGVDEANLQGSFLQNTQKTWNHSRPGYTPSLRVILRPSSKLGSTCPTTW